MTASIRRFAALTAALATLCAAVLAVLPPVSALADGPVGGDTATLPGDPAVKVTPDGDLIFRSAQPVVTVVNAVTSARHVEANFAAVKWLKGKITKAQKSIDYWNLVMGVKAPKPNSRHLTSLSLASLSRTVKVWQKLAKTTRIKAQHPPHLSEFLCIHYNPRVGSGEGGWNEDNGNGYFGGLQLNKGFMSTYNPRLLRLKGTANHWTPLEQIWTAEKAVPSRGFRPWPNTARNCGLL